MISIFNFQAIDHIPRICPKRLEFVPRYGGRYHTLLSRKITKDSDVSMSGLFIEDIKLRPALKRDASISESDFDKMYVQHCIEVPCSQ